MIPAPKKSDHEDVSWALSTAESQWAQGDKGEAIKWLRRAASAASDAEDDARALELAKVASELAVAHPPAPTVPPTPASPSKPPAAPTSVRPPGAPTPPRPATSPASVRPPSPAAPRATPSSPPRPGGRPDFAQTRPGTASKDLHAAATPKRAGRKSVPPKEERTDTTTQQRPSAPPPSSRAHPPISVTDPRSQMPTTPPAAAAVAAADADAWPTEAMGSNDLPNFEAERTRIGGAPFSLAAPGLPGSGQEKLAVSQAVRVVVWRDASGVHVAPAGTKVTAITVDAVLVALDPSADLSAWLSRK